MKSEQVITLLAILLIAGLELVALWKGVDGTALALSLALIGLLAPSPIRWIKVKNLLEIRRDNSSSEEEK
jgi:hypothetical protein